MSAVVAGLEQPMIQETAYYSIAQMSGTRAGSRPTSLAWFVASELDMRASCR